MRKKKTRKTVLDKVIPYQSLTGCAFSLRSKRGRKFWARPVKAFGRGRPWLRGTRAVMQIQLREGRGLRFAGAALRSMTPLRRVPRDWLQRNRMAETVVEGAARKDLFAGGAEKDAARGSARRVRVGENAFMRQS